MSEIDINSITPGYTGDNSGESKPSEEAHTSILQSLSDWFGTWEDYASAAEDGYQRSQSWDEASALWNSGKNTNDATIQKYIDAVNDYDTNYGGRLEKYEEWSEAYDKYDEEYNDVTSFLLATWDKGIDGLAQVTVQSLAGYAKKEVVARGIAGVTVGAFGGPQGAIAGGFGAMGAATETMITFGELLKEELANKGLSFDVDGISELRDNHPDAWQSVKTRATARGLTIGSVEGITSLVGIKGSKKVAKRYLNKYGTGLMGKTAAGVAGGTVAFTSEAAGGMLGEVAGSEVAGQEYTAKDVLVEGFAGIGTAPVTAAQGAGSAIVNRPKYKINGTGVSKSLFDKYTVNATDQEIAEMDLEVINDEQLAEKLYNRQQKAIVKTQLDTRVTDNATRDKLADLELELIKLGNNDTESANLQRKELKTKIKELVDTNAGLEVNKELEATKKSVREARSERDIARAEKLGDKIGKKVERVNNSTYKNRFLELGGKEEQFDATGVGVVVDGVALLNEDTIKEGGFLNVGAHEVLHTVIGDSFRKLDVDGKVKLIKSFTGILSDRQRVAIENRLRNDYSIDADGQLESLFADDLSMETWVDRDNLGEEVFTVFSEAILDGEIGYDETFFDSIKNKVEEILRVIGIRKEFQNGRQVYNFLKDYNKNVAKGEVSKRTEKFAKVDPVSSKTNFRKNYDEDYGYDDNFDESFDLDSDMDSDIDSDLTPKEKKKYEKTKRDKKLNDIGEKYTKAEWDEYGYTESMPQWYEDVEKIIKNNISSSLRALPNFSETDFISEAFIELSKHIKNFNIEKKKTDNGFGLSGWIRGQVSNKIGEVLKSKKATTDTFTADTSAEQFKELEATDVESMDESEDLSIGAQQKKKALAERKEAKGMDAGVEYSKTRRRIKFGDTVGLSPSVVISVKAAAKKVLSTTKIDPSDKAYKDKLNKGFLTELKKTMQDRFGSAAEFKKFLADNREVIVDALPTSTWVQIERNETNKIFTKYLRKLTKQADIQEAIDQGLIPASYRNKESVDLYMKVMPTEEQFLEFYNPPAKVFSEKKQAMVRSGLKGTRKDTLAEQLGAELAFDATMEVLMDEEVQERVSLANGQPFDASQIAAAINRGVDVRFNKRSEKITSGMVREVSKLLTKLEGKKTKFTDVIVLSKDPKGKTIYTLKTPITKKFVASGKATYSKKDSAIIAEITAKVFFSNRYGSIKNKDTYNKVLKGLVERRNDSSKKALAAYRVHEQLFINIIGDAVKNDPTLSVNRYIEEGGKGDVYITKGKTNVGIEIKMHEAFGVSQTINFTINKKGEYVFTSTNPNKVDQAAEQILLDATTESLDLVSDMLETAGLGKIKGMEITKDQVDFIDTYFLKTQMNNITTTSAEYVAAHYGDKAMPEGFIQVGDKYYRLKTKNAKVNKLVNEITEATGVEIPYFESLDGGIPLIIKPQTVKQKSGKYKLNFRIMPKISSDALVDSKANLLNEKFATKFGKATSDVLVNYSKRQNAKNLAKAIKNTTKPGYLKNTKGMSAFDFDETLIIDGENFIIATKDDKTVKISSGDWPLKGPKFAEEGYTFDFTDFVNVRGGIDGPLMKKFKSRLKRYGAKNTFILTARPMESAPAIHGWLKAKGLEIPLENITGLGSSLGAAKAEWMIEKYAEGYNDMYFVDDALPNVEAVKDALDQLDAKSNVQLAKVNFSKKNQAQADVFNQFDVKSEKQQARINFNKKADTKINELTEGITESILERRLNELVERSAGIDAGKDVSRTEASRKGKYVGKTRLFIPPGAEDFVGLMYPLLGDKKQGDADMKFIKDNLLDPLSRGERAVANKKQRIMNGYKEIKAKYYKAHSKMGKLIPGSVYTYGHAVRVQMWSEMGIEVPGISTEEVAELVNIVLKDEVISDYAIALEDLFMNEYPSPKEHWVGETIAHDMIGATLKTNRKELLSEFIENADQFFSDKNMNKLESVYGTKWREAMEDMLYRIKNGTNRSQGTTGASGKWMNWVNASVGSIMFLNGRSATLQLLSTVNFINHKENNIFAAGKAFANQKQFWADFTYLWNSDFLKQRRSGLQTDISQAEIASAVAGASNKASAAINYLLKKGFLPTQMADSFAISSGGATYYRNKVNSLVKQGVSQADAEAQAFTSFQELTEESQQSSRPDRISMQQASGLGRLILAFQNTPMQYARIIKKSMMDLQAGRGDRMSHLSKIAWYAGIQSAIFGALQSGLFLDLFDDEEELEDLTEKEIEAYQRKKDQRLSRTLTMMYSSVINGSGLTGRVISTVLSTAQEFQTQREKGFGSSENRVLLTALGIAPPISSKAQKLSKASNNIFWNEKAIEEMSLTDIDHPYYRSIALTLEAGVNLPADRAWKKFNNLRSIFDAQNTVTQRALLLAGWDPYTLAIEDANRQAIQEAKAKAKEKKKAEKKANKKSKPTKNDMNPFAKPSKKNNKVGSSSWMDNPTAAKAIKIKPSGNENDLSGSGSFRCQNISMAGAQCKNLTNNKSKRCYLHD